MARCVRLLLTDPASGSQERTSRHCTAHIQASVDDRSGEGTAPSSSSGRPGAGVCPPRRGDPSSSTGPGSRFPMMERNHLSGQLFCHVAVADLATAFWTVPVSMRVSCCGRAPASRTRTSARSLPDSPQWAGTHHACRQAVPCPLAVAAVPRWPRPPALSGRPGRSVAGLAPPLSRYRRPPGGSRHGCLLSTAPPPLLLCRAKSSERVLEQREPAATRTSRACRRSGTRWWLLLLCP